MKKTNTVISFILILTMILSFGSTAMASDSTGTDIIQITDTDLEQTVRNLINKPSGDILKSDVENITELSITNPNIKDISSLSYFTNLKSLYILGTLVDDISVINRLNSLEAFYLDSDVIKSIDNLNEIPSLTTLYIRNKQINDISVLSKMINLKTLYLNEIPTSDFSAISNLSKLETLVLLDTGLKSTKVLENFQNLKAIGLGGSSITDFDALKKIQNIKSLELINTQFDDLSFLSNSLDIMDLDIQNSKITDFSPISKLTKLETLSIISNQVSNIDFLSGLKSLTLIDLSKNNITEIGSLSDLISLVNLNLSDNQIKDISSLSGLNSLKNLTLSNNQIKDINTLSNLTNLMALNLSTNSIENINPLSKLTSLNILDVSNNKITDIKALESLKSLAILYLSGNNITDFKPVSVIYKNLIGKDFELTPGYNVLINGKDGATLDFYNDLGGVVIKDLFEAIGATYSYDIESKLVKITRGDTKIELRINSFNATVNGSNKILNFTPILVDGVPVCNINMLSILFGASVSYDNNSDLYKISIKAPESGSKVKIKVNGKTIKFDNTPISIDGKIKVSLKSLAEAFRAKYSYSSKTKVITIAKGKTKVTLKIGSSTAYVNGKSSKLEASAVLNGTKPFGPLKSITAIFGGRIKYDSKSQTYSITIK